MMAWLVIYLKILISVIPKPDDSALKICKLIKHSGDVVGYELSNSKN